jgi:hypothetical protein
MWHSYQSINAPSPRGMQLKGGKGVIEGSGSKMEHLKLRSPGDIKPALIKKLVREAVALNREMGDPTRNQEAMLRQNKTMPT